MIRRRDPHVVWDPPAQQVNVTRMVIYSFIPILAFYAAWRIQKFWMLFAINVGIGFVSGLVIGVVYALQMFSQPPVYAQVAVLAITIPVNIIIVRSFARSYNAKVAASNPQPTPPQ